MEAIRDSGAIVLARGAAPPLTIRYSFPFAVYQHLMHLLRRSPRQGEDTDGIAYRAALDRLREIYFPIGPFNALELGAAGAETIAGFGGEIRARAAAIAEGISAAVAGAEAIYREQLWPAHGPMLADALARARASLEPHKDELLARLAGALGIERQTAGYEVNLVPVCHEPTGGYSHPIVVNVATFQGLHLVEAVLHELAHVMLHHDREGQGNLYAALDAGCARRKRPARVGLELLHLYVFHATGELTRERYGEEHVPWAQARGLHARTSALLRADVSHEAIAAIWARRGEGPRATAELLLDRAAAPQ